jgi:hypothetical protein
MLSKKGLGSVKFRSEKMRMDVMDKVVSGIIG